MFADQAFQHRPGIPPAYDQQETIRKIAHRQHGLLPAPVHVDARTLQDQDEAIIRQVKLGARWPGAKLPRHGNVAHHLHVHTVSFPIDRRDALVHRDHLSQLREDPTLDQQPGATCEGPAGQFRHLGEEFMGIVYQPDAPQPCGHETGRQSIQVVGEEQIGTGEKEPEEEPDIELGVKKWPLVEQQPHATDGVGSLQRRAVGQFPPDRQDLVAQFLQDQAGAVYPIVRGQVVGHGNDGAWPGGGHADKVTPSTP